jgi:hypothetical protein
MRLLCQENPERGNSLPLLRAGSNVHGSSKMVWGERVGLFAPMSEVKQHQSKCPRVMNKLFHLVLGGM